MAPAVERFPPEHGELLDAAPDAMVVVDSAGKIVFANTQTGAIFGHDRGMLVDQPVEVLIPESKRAAHHGHRAKYASDPKVRPMGAGLRLQGLRKDGSVFPVEISLSPLSMGGAHYTIAAIRDVSDRLRLEADERRQLVTRRLVRHILREIGSHVGNSAQTRRELGRTMATETEAHTLEEYLEALDAAGVGKLTVGAAEKDRYVFVGDRLLEVTPGYKEPTCHIALGYAESVVSALHGRQALGAEIACQSKGHPLCRFVISLR